MYKIKIGNLSEICESVQLYALNYDAEETGNSYDAATSAENHPELVLAPLLAPSA